MVTIMWPASFEGCHVISTFQYIPFRLRIRAAERERSYLDILSPIRKVSSLRTAAFVVTSFPVIAIASTVPIMSCPRSRQPIARSGLPPWRHFDLHAPGYCSDRRHARSSEPQLSRPAEWPQILSRDGETGLYSCQFVPAEKVPEPGVIIAVNRGEDSKESTDPAHQNNWAARIEITKERYHGQSQTA